MKPSLLLRLGLAFGVLVFAAGVRAGEPFTTRGVDAKILEARCAEHVSVSSMEDRDGAVGAYIINLDILDSPVEFLDAHGQHLTTFHIFAPDQERIPASKIVERYRKRFPIQKSADCRPYVKKKAAP